MGWEEKYDDQPGGGFNQYGNAILIGINSIRKSRAAGHTGGKSLLLDQFQNFTLLYVSI